MPELSPENLEKQLTSTEEESLEMKKSIEIEEEIIEDFIKEDGIKENDKEQTIEWIKKYGERFRDIVDNNEEVKKLIKQGNKEGAKEKIKQELEKEIIH